LSPEETAERTLELVIPNEVTRGLYLERIRQILMPLGTARTAADAMLFSFLQSGEIEPLLEFVETNLFPAFSNRDATWANELTVKTLLMTLLWNDVSYVVHSEPELGHRYADLCLLRRPDARAANLCDLLFELKRIPLKSLKRSGKEVTAMERAELTALEPVRNALDEAQGQIEVYRQALQKRYGSVLRLRAWAVVAVGFERLVARALP